MERLKKQRTPIRTITTRTINETELELASENILVLSIKAKYEKLNGLYLQIQGLDQRILEHMLDDENFDEVQYQTEVDTIQEYVDRIVMMKLKIDEIVNQHEQRIQTQNESITSVYGTTNFSKRQFKLPKIELKKFDGKIINWLSWWSQFKKIHEDVELHTTDKFQYLIQSMEPKTRCYEIVNSFPASEENYQKAIEALKERFGKKKLLTQVYIRELFKMGLQNLNKKTEITSMYDTLICHVRALESLDITLEQATLFLYPMIESSLPEEILIAWQRSPLYEKDGSLEKPPKGELDYLLQFLQQEVERQEQRSLVKSGFEMASGTSNNKVERKKDSNTPTALNLFNGQGKNLLCIFCEKNHESKDCAKVEVWSIDDMKKRIQEKKCCLKCLKVGHTAAKCRSFVRCHVCSQPHVTIMCPELKKKKIKPTEEIHISTTIPSTKKSNNSEMTQQSLGFSGANLDISGDVLLKTVMTYICVNNNRKKLVRILFDDGCQRSCITKSIIKSIQSIPVGNECIRNILFDGSKTNYQTTNIHRISLTNIDGSNKIQLMVREKSKIGGNISKIPKGFWISDLERNGIIFSDIEGYTNQTTEIDIVIGSDYWGHLVTGKKHSLRCGLHAFETIFGWTLSGILPKENVSEEIISMFLSEENLKNLWSLDVIGIKDPIEKLTEIQEEAEAKKIFMNTVKRNHEGRYQVKLPWINGVQEIPNNKIIATNRLISTTKRLNTTNHFANYDDIIKSWIKEGFIKQVQSKDDHKKCHYLPHHPVFKESPTTPVRPVFDASCKTGRNPSLNNCLFKGPNNLELLTNHLMRFRLKLVGALSDIRKAFQMIDVDEEDTEYLRFLWWEDTTQQKVIVLQHLRVVFGLICSPYLLAAVLEHLLLNIPEPRKEIAKQLLKALYVDNCVTSFDSHDEYRNFKKISVELLAEAKMDLRQWESTFEKDYEPKNESEETKVLGMQWNKKYDFLHMKIPTIEITEKLTKRNIASILHQFFDPIGFSCPALLRPKIMLQNTWKKNISWDCELPQLWRDQFQRWYNEVQVLKEIKIPRLCQIPGSTNRELHTFSDASQDAYAAVVYLRTEKEGHVEVQLIQAKSRVAPIAKTTIPRLELLACLISSRLGNSVVETLNFEDLPKYFWSDSSTAIAWIQRNNNWGTFVGNRVRKILQITNEHQWRHVPGALNPADLPSRGCNPKELVESKWWEGPNWLKLSKENWPNNKFEIDENEVNSEQKKTTINLLSIQKISWFVCSDRFVTYASKLRVMTWIQRFVNNLKRKMNKEGYLIPNMLRLSIQEIRSAEVHLIKVIQFESNLDLKNDKQLQKFTFDLRIDGAIRMRTPITKRIDSDSFRYPYLLSRHHPLVRQLILDTHIQYGHSGVQFIMGKLREKYWITQMRKTVSSVINGCKKCKRFTTKQMNVRTASLPEKRVKSGEIFDTTGVDLFGHLTLKNKQKVWVVLYTCAVYRAVQLDIIDSINTQTFIQSLKRFIFQFGRPNTIMSDNGTNFVGTANLLRTINKEEFKKACDVEKISWEFIPPAAPWWGGFWERMVRSVKEPLRRILGNSVITYDQLKTVLMEVVSVINDRPLTTVTENPEDLEPLTPNMFLRGTKNASFPEEEEITSKQLQEQWRRIKEFSERLQGRFRREYLGQLVEHSKTSKSSEINVGDIVLVGADNKKRLTWPMARVIEIMPSTDREIRTARVKTKFGCLVRPLQRLYPLEMSKINSKPLIFKEVKDQQLQEQETKSDSTTKNTESDVGVNDKNVILKTKSGRIIKKPDKYGWN